MKTTHSFQSNHIILSLALITILALIIALLINECAFTAGMGAAYKSCDCAGIEWLQYDRTPADGPRRTVCLGIVRSVDCYRYMDGPAVACD